MAGENISQKFRLKNMDKARKYLVEEINQNELIIEKHKKVCATPNHIEHFITLSSTIIGGVFISSFASLVGIPKRITSYVIGWKICEITAAIKKYKSKINNKKKKRNTIK